MRIKSLGNGRWHIDVHVYKTGRIYRTFPSKGKKATRQEAKIQAQKWEQELLTERDKKEASNNLKFTRFQQVLEHFKDTPNRNGKKRDVKQYIYDRLMSDLGHLYLEEVREGLKRLQVLLKTEVNKRNQCYHNSTINRHIAMAKAADNQALVDGKTDKLFLQRYPTLKENNITYRILETKERERLWKNLPKWFQPMWYFSSRIPCRIGEVTNLRRENLLLSENRLFLNGSLTKNGEPRKLIIPSEMRLYFETIPDECEWLFFRYKNGSFNPMGYVKEGEVVPNIRKAWNNILEDAEIEGYNWHKTRQQAAMQLIAEKKYDERMVKLIGGWKTDAAFNRYINDQMIYDITTGAVQFDTTWYERMKPREATYYMENCA